MITIGDILDEIAEFTSEQPDGQSPNIEPSGDNRWQVAGDTSLEEVNYELDLALVVDGADRIAGWVTAHARRFPKTGDIIAAQQCRATVLQMRKHRITRVLIEKDPELSESEQEKGVRV